ncbi:glutathione-regulated potassium-efflux system protein KefC [Noviherbaspirillum massiliense]|uniref:glutathione-regulated potassium-efflux system protein KefC n=1 Tax=Noviherbaspirillum massiliense TaxID=1465823 RepID=UPI0005572B76|nr:glutathione-regulated potassium-efflux system protein KefC [Noviherbaspirillum massiliense]
MENSLLPNALIYLTATVIAVPIAKRLGLGAVLGYLLAGIAIGPWGLRLISGVEDILHFSEFGVVLLLFVIGLELDPKRLWSMRRSIFGWGSAQMICVASLLFVVALGAGYDWKIGLIAALGLSLSSTAIALATLEERNLKSTTAGTAGFSILLFQDIAAIPMIAIIPFLGTLPATASTEEGWITAIKAIAVIGALVFGGRYLMRPVLRLIAKTDLREIFTAFALLLVIGIGLLMQSVGLSMALGTFLAGVLLADTEYRHALETDLEPFKGLLLGLFFTAVGMSIDFGVLLTQPLLIAALLAVFLTLKIGMLYLLSKFFGIPRGQQALFAFLLSQGGEFAFVVFGAAATAQIFSADTASLLIVVVALSMALTPLLLLIHDRIIQPLFRSERNRPDDRMEPQDNPVIIAGFGRFGQIVGRLLFANRIGVTVLDHDPDQVDLLRKFGFKVFYGNATRIDLLRSAGVARAKVLVVAIDDAEGSLALVDAVRREFPDLKILARARNVTHYYDLMDRGVTVIERETFEAALQLGRNVLREVGFGAFQARQAAMRFREYNIKSLHAVYPYYKDQEQYISLSAQAREELQQMIARDAEALRSERRNGWD